MSVMMIINRNFIVSIAALMAFMMAGCQNTILEDGGRADEFFERTEAIPFESVEIGTYGSREIEAQNRVIKEEADFRKFWNRLHANKMPPPPVPEVDFTQEMVVATVMGPRPSGGYIAEITGAASGAGQLGIRIKNRQPGDDCVVTAALTNPFHIIKMDRKNLEVRFFEEKVVRDCSG